MPDGCRRRCGLGFGSRPALQEHRDAQRGPGRDDLGRALRRRRGLAGAGARPGCALHRGGRVWANDQPRETARAQAPARSGRVHRRRHDAATTPKWRGRCGSLLQRTAPAPRPRGGAGRVRPVSAPGRIPDRHHVPARRSQRARAKVVRARASSRARDAATSRGAVRELGRGRLLEKPTIGPQPGFAAFSARKPANEDEKGRDRARAPRAKRPRAPTDSPRKARTAREAVRPPRRAR